MAASAVVSLMLSARTLLGLGMIGARAWFHARRRARRTVGVTERLAQLPRGGLPLRAPVRIRWNDHHVPFIEAEHDRDLAVALGVVHAHLRLTQIDIMRRAAYGRLAEVFGPPAINLDHTLRTLDLTRAVPEIRAGLPDETQAWLSGFADGINAVLERGGELPEDLAALGIRPEPWGLDDVLAVSRLAAADFTWVVWAPLLALRGRADWETIWPRILAAETAGPPGFAGSSSPDPLSALGAVGRIGSNSAAVMASHSATGGALMANDPHLSIVLPNLFLIAGFRSPGHHAVGLMAPGVPGIGLGRNPWIAWGGTSLHAASSDLFDVTGLPAEQWSTRTETIKVRWAKDVTVTIRETPFGPVISDAPLVPAPPDRALALRWVGHRPSDETTSLLRIGRARDWSQFLAALEPWAAPALHMTYADAEGSVGQCMAAHLPHRPAGSDPADLFVSSKADAHWNRFATVSSLPQVFDPECGFVVSANNRPDGNAGVLISHFFAPEARVRRLRGLLSVGPVTVQTLRESQRDVVMESALDLRDEILALCPPDEAAGTLLDLLRAWDGSYRPEAKGPAALELLIHHLVHALNDRDDVALFSAAREPWTLLRRDLAALSPERTAPALRRAVARAQRDLGRFAGWGDMHRLVLNHPFAAAPVLGKRYRFVDAPVGGGNETLMKTAHGFSGTRHQVRFGAMARHVSDLSDMDANDFALLGGQDGWLGGAAFLDQVPLWREGRYIRAPLRPESVRAAFPHETMLTPSSPSSPGS